MWGASVTGTADTKLAALRLASLRAEGRVPPGTSVALRLRATQRGSTRDPWIVHVCDGVKHWMLSVHSCMPDIGPLRACLEEAQPLLLKDRPWAQ
eukprot:8144432-Pyramimonas_sp.AAC.1